MPALLKHFLRQALPWILIGVLVGSVWHLPARFLDLALSGVTKGALRLADARGSIWSGSAQLQWWPQSESVAQDAGVAPTSPISDRTPSAAVVLVDRLAWRVAASVTGDATSGLPPMRWGVLLDSPRLQGDIRTKVLLLPSVGALLGWGTPTWTVPSGSIDLPPADLRGSPQTFLAIAAPTFSSRVQWSGLSSTSNPADEARIDIELRQFASALSPIRPLGDYRLAVQRESGRWGWQLASEPGSALELSGRGGIRRGPTGSVQFRCQRDCEFMAGLLALIGKRQGSTYELQLGL
jgi:general secretion pathway protein N